MLKNIELNNCVYVVINKICIYKFSGYDFKYIEIVDIYKIILIIS